MQVIELPFRCLRSGDNFLVCVVEVITDSLLSNIRIENRLSNLTLHAQCATSDALIDTLDGTKLSTNAMAEAA